MKYVKISALVIVDENNPEYKHFPDSYTFNNDVVFNPATRAIHSEKIEEVDIGEEDFISCYCMERFYQSDDPQKMQALMKENLGQTCSTCGSVIKTSGELVREFKGRMMPVYINYKPFDPVEDEEEIRSARKVCCIDSAEREAERWRES